MKNYIIMGVLALGLSVTLSGCSKEKLFGSTDGPDEFAVVKQKPLTMPTNTTALPAPSNVPQSVVNEEATRERLKDLLGSSPVPTQITAGDEQVLQMAGAVNAPDDIAERLASDQKAKQDDQRILDKWLQRDIQADPAVDLDKEKQRLKTLQNKQDVDKNIPAKTASGEDIVIGQ